MKHFLGTVVVAFCTQLHMAFKNNEFQPEKAFNLVLQCMSILVDKFPRLCFVTLTEVKKHHFENKFIKRIYNCKYFLIFIISGNDDMLCH